MKCDLCKNEIKQTFLEKPIGTFVKDEKGKKHPVCFECQRKLGNSKERMLESI